MTSVFSWQNSISVCPASFCTPRPNLPVTPDVSWRRNGNPLQCSYLENPKEGGSWWAAVYGVSQSRTRLKRLSSSSSSSRTGKFGLGVQNEARQRLIQFCQDNALVIANTLSNNTREDSTHGHHQMGNTEIRLIIFFAAKDGEALYSQQKQVWS